jgi:hypothetical protein
MTDNIGRDKRPEKKPQRTRKQQYIGPDGVRRPPKVEHNLNEAFAITFRDQCGKDVLDYLKSITTNRVLEPGLPENTYSYQEGARWLMGVISTRVQHGEDKKP